MHCLGKNLIVDDNVHFERLLVDSEGFTGADLQAVFYNAHLLSIHELLDPTSNQKNSQSEAFSTNQHLLIRGTLPTLSFLSQKNQLENNKKSRVVIQERHLLKAFKEAKPSLSRKERQRFESIYHSFTQKDENSTAVHTIGSRSTLK